MSSAVMQKEEWAYQSETALIVPHVGSLVNENFPEDFLVRLYLKMKQDGSLRRTLPNVSEHSLGNFVSYFFNKTMLICVTKPDNKFAGFVWLYDIQGNEKSRRGSVGVCMFKEYWGNPVIYELGHLALDWIFKEIKLSIVLGTIASWNRASVRYGKMLGFVPSGTIPMFFLKEDDATSMTLMYLTKEIHCGSGVNGKGR